MKSIKRLNKERDFILKRAIASGQEKFFLLGEEIARRTTVAYMLWADVYYSNQHHAAWVEGLVKGYNSYKWYSDDPDAFSRIVAEIKPFVRRLEALPELPYPFGDVARERNSIGNTFTRRAQVWIAKPDEHSMDFLELGFPDLNPTDLLKDMQTARSQQLGLSK